MQIIRIDSRELHFGPFASRHDVPLLRQFALPTIPMEDQDTLQDIELELFTRPCATVGNTVGLCPDDIHVYFATEAQPQQDITQFVVNALMARLQQQVAAVAKAGYQDGLAQWIANAQRYSTSQGINVTNEQQVAAQQLLLTPPQWLDRLGNASTGWKGNAHVLNYVYDTIRLTRLSLRGILSSAGLSLPTNTLGRLVFSIGSLGDPAAPTPAGSLVLRAHYIHTNPLDRKFFLLEQRVVLLERQVADIMLSLLAVEEDLDGLYEYLSPFRNSISTICVSVDSSTGDNGALACDRLAYPGHGDHADVHELGQVFSNWPQVGGKPKVGIIAGHGNEGVMSVGGGQNLEPNKYLSSFNKNEWVPHLQPWRGRIRALSFGGCHVGAGSMGARFLHEVARVVGCYVTAPTGFVYCSGGTISYEPGTRWQVACGASAPDPIDAPSIHYVARGWSMMITLHSQAGWVNVPLDHVQAIAVYRPAANMGKQAMPIVTLSTAESQGLAAEVLFDAPAQQGVVSGLRSAVVTLTWDGGTAGILTRDFHVYNERLLQDNDYRDTYYYATSAFTDRLREILGALPNRPLLP